MTNQEKTNLILEAMRSDVEKFVEQEDKIESATEYEDYLLELARKFAAGLAAHSGKNTRTGRNAKKKS